MPLSWFICTYKRAPGQKPLRYPEMDDFTDQINADGGAWSETEVLGGYAVVKVRASATTLAAIASDPAHPSITRIPNNLRLSDTLGSLTSQQLNYLHNLVLSMGYTDAEITAALGNNWRQRTLGQVLRFCASRRLKPRYDTMQDLIVLDGPVQACKLVDDVDAEIGE